MVMKGKYTKAITKAMIMSLVLTTALPQALVKAAPGQVTRVGDVDSYETAAIVATENWTSAQDVVLVCGEGYADAVSASVLAKQLNAPILLTQSASLNTNAKDALAKLKPQNIYIIGGNASVSQSVRNGLKSDKFNLIELSGKNRYETNMAVANQLVKLGIKADNVMVVSGEGFSDVLSATPVAAAKGQILLLANNSDSTVKQVQDFIKANNSKVTVIGTSNSINDNTYKTLGATERISGGADRFETNLNVLNAFKSDLKSDKVFVANASGDRYADALIASSLAGKWSAPLVLVDDETANSTSKAINYIKTTANSSSDLNVIGGSSIVSAGIVSKVNNAVSKPVVDKPTVNSVSTIGLNQIKVVFNTEVDEDSAELIKNYQIEGNSLSSTLPNQATATLQSDKRTVLITLSTPYGQYKDVTFTVKNAILDEELSNTIPKYEQTITFSETSAPTLESVKAVGGNKLVVKFSEPIRMTSSVLSYMKINRQSITNYGLDESETKFFEQSGEWADKVELYFNSPLPTGQNVFSMPNGDIGKKFDNAGKFPLKGTYANFNIDSVAGAPQVKSIRAVAPGTLYVTFDRAMDQQTALEDSNYKINGTTPDLASSDIEFEDDSDDTVVKIKSVSQFLKSTGNTLTVKGNISDTYGNQINENSISFDLREDANRPKVTNVTVIDGDTMRIKFNKEVNNSYATSKSNYKIVDADGTEITYKIDDIDAVFDSDGTSKTTYDIEFKDKTDLKGSKYTLTVKNIVDTNNDANVMEPYTTEVAGLGESQAAVLSIIKRQDSDNEVVIFFNKAMSPSSLSIPENYFFIDGTGDTRTLPRSAVIVPGADGKSVSIQFPSSYLIESGTKSINVVQMGVANVKDKDGNLLGSIAYRGDITKDSSNGPSLIDNTGRLYYEGNDIKVKVSLTGPLDILNLSDFRVAGKNPDSGIMSGNDIIFTYKAGVKNNEKINAIKNSGSTVTFSISNPNSVDTAGRKIKSGSDVILLPPRTVANSWIANSNASSGGNPSASIVFDQNIDNDIESSYNDDFIFKNERTGENLQVVGIRVDGRSVIYKFYNGSVKAGDIIDVCANSVSNSISIRSDAHNGDTHAVYVPTSDDLKVRTITVKY